MPDWSSDVLRNDSELTSRPTIFCFAEAQKKLSSFLLCLGNNGPRQFRVENPVRAVVITKPLLVDDRCARDFGIAQQKFLRRSPDELHGVIFAMEGIDELCRA
jgi:hypothetical protein